MLLIKHEWHHVDSQYVCELTTELLSSVYPDLEEEDINDKLVKIQNGHIDIEELINDANDADIPIEWEPHYDDWWTVRKGGFDVTYELDFNME